MWKVDFLRSMREVSLPGSISAWCFDENFLDGNAPCPSSSALGCQPNSQPSLSMMSLIIHQPQKSPAMFDSSPNIYKYHINHHEISNVLPILPPICFMKMAEISHETLSSTSHHGIRLRSADGGPTQGSPHRWPCAWCWVLLGPKGSPMVVSGEKNTWNDHYFTMNYWFWSFSLLLFFMITIIILARMNLSSSIIAYQKSTIKYQSLLFFSIHYQLLLLLLIITILYHIFLLISCFYCMYTYIRTMVNIECADFARKFQFHILCLPPSLYI